MLKDLPNNNKICGLWDLLDNVQLLERRICQIREAFPVPFEDDLRDILGGIAVDMSGEL